MKNFLKNIFQNKLNYFTGLKVLFVIFLTGCGGDGASTSLPPNQLENQSVSNLARPPESSFATSPLYQGVIIVGAGSLQGEASSSQYKAKSPSLEFGKERIVHAKNP